MVELVSRALQDILKPDYIYLMHVYRNHFHGPSLRKFGKDQRILIPRAPDTRMWRDLKQMAFRNVTEIEHGRSPDLAPGFGAISTGGARPLDAFGSGHRSFLNDGAATAHPVLQPARSAV